MSPTEELLVQERKQCPCEEQPQASGCGHQAANQSACICADLGLGGAGFPP